MTISLARNQLFYSLVPKRGAVRFGTRITNVRLGARIATERLPNLRPSVGTLLAADPIPGVPRSEPGLETHPCLCRSRAQHAPPGTAPPRGGTGSEPARWSPVHPWIGPGSPGRQPGWGRGSIRRTIPFRHAGGRALQRGSQGYAAAGRGQLLNMASAWMMTCFVSVSRCSGLTPRRRRTALTVARTVAFTSSRWGLVQSTLRFLFTA